MTYYTLLLLIFGTLFGCYLLWLFWQRMQHQKLERFLENAVLSESQKRHLERIPLYRALAADEHARIERMILRFVHTREFCGVRLEVNEEMRTVVAFYAALMLLYKGERWLDHVKTVWLYEGGFLAEESFDEGGIVSSGTFELDGQSGPDAVVLSWEDAKREAYGLEPFNVIIHEFAHALDFADGVADGMPPIAAAEARTWAETIDRGYLGLLQRLHRQEELGAYARFGEYAAENEAEFFAVASELFYRCPAWMHDCFPELFGLLGEFYGVDPRRWGLEAPYTDAMSPCDPASKEITCPPS